MRILVAGGSGFVGRRLIERLSKIDEYEVSCITRRPDSLRGLFSPRVKILKADATNYDDLVRVLEGVDVAFYLIHSMEGKDWRRFAERDRIAAENFARAATECKVKRIIYLGGLSHEKDEELSEHMRSRREVGEILKGSSAKVTILNAAMIIGEGGASFEMLRYLVERLPFMLCPRWVLTRSQPIDLDDVVSYLINVIKIKESENREFDIGGPDILTYAEMMKIYGKTIHKNVRIFMLPFLTPRLSSYWIDLVTPIRASLARPLIDSLRHELVVKDRSIQDLIPLQLKRFEDAIKISRRVEQRTKIEYIAISLLISLLFLGLVHDIFLPILPLYASLLWYVIGISALFFILKRARLGALSAGIVGWAILIPSIMHLDSSNLIFITISLASILLVLVHYLFHYTYNSR